MRRRFFFSFGRRQALDIAQHTCLKSVIREEFGRQLYTSSFEAYIDYRRRLASLRISGTKAWLLSID